VLGNRGLRIVGGARLFELGAHGERLWRTVPHDSPQAQAVRRYCEGINAYLAARPAAGVRLPRELWLLRTRPAPWAPADVMAVMLAQGLLLDLELPQLGRAAGANPGPPVPPDSLMALLESLRYDTISPEAARALYGGGDGTGSRAPGPRPSGAAGSDALAQRARRDLQRLGAAWEDAGLGPGASNAFAVGGARSASGSGLLANDPHLRLTAPGYWYAVHLTVPDTVDAAGAGVPGLPALVTGRNRDLAWGVTALSGQAMEVYADTLDAAGKRVRWQGGWVPLRRESSGLRYRALGLPLPIPGMARRYTPHGPVLRWDRKRRLAYSVRWAGLVESTGFGVIGLESARTLNELRAHAAALFTPTLNLIAADRAGGLLYQVTGSLPRRGYAMPWGPTPGGGSHEWSGHLRADELPSWREPATGYLVNANNRPVGDPYPHFIGYYDWANDRARRMAQRLAGDSVVDAADMRSVQNDVYSLEAERLLPHLLRHADSLAASLPGRTRAALDTLRAWDRRAARGSTAPTLYRTWVNTLADSAEVRGYVSLLHAALDGRAPALLVRGARGRSPAAVVVRALTDALEALAKAGGPDPRSWTWDRVHRARFSHALEWKDRSLSPAPVPADGDAGTVRVGASGLPARTTFTHGPSLRHVVDLAIADSSWFVLPPGNAGEQSGPHGRDHLPLWQEHRYAPLYLSWERAEAARESEWRLVP
jgi:penicillin amidase